MNQFLPQFRSEYIPWSVAIFLLIFILAQNRVGSVDDSTSSQNLSSTTNPKWPSVIYETPQYKRVHNVFTDPYYNDKYHPTDQYYLRPFATNEPAKYHSIYRNPSSFWPLYGGRYDWLSQASYFGDWGLQNYSPLSLSQQRKNAQQSV